MATFQNLFLNFEPFSVNLVTKNRIETGPPIALIGPYLYVIIKPCNSDFRVKKFHGLLKNK